MSTAGWQFLLQKLSPWADAGQFCCVGWISDNSTLLTTVQTSFLPGMLQSVAVDLDQPHTKWLFLGKPRVDSASMSTGFVI